MKEATIGDALIRIALAALFVTVVAVSTGVALPAGAVPVQVTVTGEVEFNQVTDPPLGNVNPQDLVQLTFRVDSEVFVDSGSFPTRGYPIDPTSFSLLLGTTEVGLQDPFPPGEKPYFVLRDNDPAVDGFFVGTSVDFPVGVPIGVTGIFGQFRNVFSVTYEGDVLSSLDIVEAAGTYDFTQLTVFGWTIDDGPFSPLGIIFSEMTIAVETPIFADGFESGDTTAWD